MYKKYLALILTLFLSVGLVWVQPTDGEAIEHGGADYDLLVENEAIGNWSNGTGTNDFYYEDMVNGVRTNITINENTNGNYSWSIPGDLIGNYKLWAVEDNGTRTNSSEVEVTIKAYTTSDIVNIFGDLIGSYTVQGVTFVSVLVIGGLWVFWQKKKKQMP